MKNLVALTLFLFFSLVLKAQVVINEYSASNISHYSDNFGNNERALGVGVNRKRKQRDRNNSKLNNIKFWRATVTYAALN